MWLLSTERAVLCYFAAPEHVPRGYAILSHTWGNDEQTFQEIKALEEQYQAENTNPRDHVSDKIRNACIAAQKDGYTWIWIDSCCINKESSAELSEAINSMFLWYSQAEMCYAYLADVPSDCLLDAQDSSFRKSRWHTRGWTLQELVAPAFVTFMSQDWQLIGDKHTNADLLEEVTGVWSDVLTHEYHFSDTSIATRMHWASKRITTRVEDEAYCLMGLFDVNMPTIYGEGRKAFHRLQHEIMRQSYDTSLFAWGINFVDPSRHWTCTEQPLDAVNANKYLLAPSAKYFEFPAVYTPFADDPIEPYLDEQWTSDDPQTPEFIARRASGPFNSIELPRFSATSYGIKCRIPIIEAEGLTVAVLLCETDDEAHATHLGLTLHLAARHDPSRPLYHTGTVLQRDDGRTEVCRVIPLGNDLYNLRLFGKRVRAEWRVINIVPDAPRDATVFGPLAYHLITHTQTFRIPAWLCTRISALGFTLTECREGIERTEAGLEIAIRFHDPWFGESIALALGVCTLARSGSSSVRPGGKLPAWAMVAVGHTRLRELPPIHDCATDHIDGWGGQKKAFGDGKRTVQLSFTPCNLNPKETLLVRIHLVGPVFRDMQRRANVWLSSRGNTLLGQAQPPPSQSQKGFGVGAPFVEVEPRSVRLTRRRSG